MEVTTACDSFAALAHPLRVEVYRSLVKAGGSGMTAGEIARRHQTRLNTMSANLAVLARAHLIRSRREGRSIRYFADMDGTRDLLAFLLEDC